MLQTTTIKTTRHEKNECERKKFKVATWISNQTNDNNNNNNNELEKYCAMQHSVEVA